MQHNVILQVWPLVKASHPYQQESDANTSHIKVNQSDFAKLWYFGESKLSDYQSGLGTEKHDESLLYCKG